MLVCLLPSGVYKSFENSEVFIILWMDENSVFWVFFFNLCSVNKIGFVIQQRVLSFASLLKWKLPKVTNKTFHHFGTPFCILLIMEQQAPFICWDMFVKHCDPSYMLYKYTYLSCYLQCKGISGYTNANIGSWWVDLQPNNPF